ncbi:PEGA domain-containing protein [Geopsychrobacter electrodiphilus]|uniref:PEGA domain-containing protein n=1 Tax=Geopsychrobacter electrodiphilus TaxID=225196 RepID=UPI0003776ACB|nr:PEGA domain-containing protein [Geopsychrobacter electrodiphilus]
MLKNLICLILLTTFTCACAPTRALIQSEPPGAMVIMDGQELGVTPISYSHKLSSGENHEISLQHLGFESIDMTIKADKTDSSALKSWLTAGVIWSPLWIGTLFTKKLKESYMFVMKRNPQQMTASLGQEAQK